MLISYCVCIILLIVYWLFAAWQNKTRDRKYGKPAEASEDMAETFVDITDKKQHDFRYTT